MKFVLRPKEHLELCGEIAGAMRKSKQVEFESGKCKIGDPIFLTTADVGP